MRDHTDLLNYIAKKIRARSYLEIGVFNPNHNFNKIQVKNKLSVDPDPAAKAMVQMTSDDFFGSIMYADIDYSDSFSQLNRSFDLIFIDGLHHAGQVSKDLLNSWQCVLQGGVIVMHDTNPPTEQTTCVPRGDQREWCGDVYKVAAVIGGAEKITVDFDYGCTVLRKGTQDLAFMRRIITWDYFDKNRKDLLNLMSVDQAIERIDSWE